MPRRVTKIRLSKQILATSRSLNIKTHAFFSKVDVKPSRIIGDKTKTKLKRFPNVYE